MGNLGGWEIVIIIGVLVLLFGAKKLPDMARSIGQSARVFKGEMKGLRSDEETPRNRAVTEPPTTQPPASTTPQEPAPANQSGRTDQAR